MRSSLLASVFVRKFQMTEEYSSCDLRGKKYIYRESREEREKVIV
jgi:hypothetical protein